MERRGGRQGGQKEREGPRKDSGPEIMRYSSAAVWRDGKEALRAVNMNEHCMF